MFHKCLTISIRQSLLTLRTRPARPAAAPRYDRAVTAALAAALKFPRASVVSGARASCLAAAALLAACGDGSEGSASATNRSAQVAPSTSKAQGPQPSKAAPLPTADAGNTAAPTPKRRVRPHKQTGITAIALAPDGGTLAAANADGKVNLLDAASLNISRVIKSAGPAAVALVFSADGRILFGAARDSVARGWDAQTGAALVAMNGHEHPLRAIAGSIDGTVVATAGEETRVMLWDGLTGRLKQIVIGHIDFVNALSMSVDGRLLASGGADARVLIWDVGTGKLLHTLLGHADELAAVALSADGKWLASAALDAKVILWDVASGVQVQALKGHSAPVLSLAFNRDGSLLAGGAEDGRVIVWDTDTFKPAREIAGPGPGVNTVTFDMKNNNRLYAGSQDGRVVTSIVPPSAGR